MYFLINNNILMNVTLSIVSCPLEAPCLIASLEQYTVLENSLKKICTLFYNSIETQNWHELLT